MMNIDHFIFSEYSILTNKLYIGELNKDLTIVNQCNEQIFLSSENSTTQPNIEQLILFYRNLRTLNSVKI